MANEPGGVYIKLWTANILEEADIEPVNPPRGTRHVMGRYDCGHSDIRQNGWL